MYGDDYCSIEEERVGWTAVRSLMLSMHEIESRMDGAGRQGCVREMQSTVTVKITVSRKLNSFCRLGTAYADDATLPPFAECRPLGDLHVFIVDVVALIAIIEVLSMRIDNKRGELPAINATGIKSLCPTLEVESSGRSMPIHDRAWVARQMDFVLFAGVKHKL